MSDDLHRSSRGPLIICLVLLAALAAVVLPRLDVATDMSFFTPADTTPETAVLTRGVAASGSLLMIGLRGPDAETLAAASDAVARRLRATSGFVAVTNGRSHLPPELLDYVLDNGFLLGPPPAADTFADDGLRTRLKAGLARLAGIEGWVYRTIYPRDPVGRLDAFTALLRGIDGPPRRHGVWMTDDGQALLLARLSASAGDIAGQAAARAAVSKAVSGVEGAITWVASGPGQFALEASEKIRAEMQVLSVIATVVVAVLLLAAFRSPIILVLVGLPVAFGLLIGLAVTQGLFGRVHGVAVTFGAVLVGVAADYVIHLTGLREPGETPVGTARRLARPLFLGAGTTLAGLLALSQSSFPGLAQIGTLAAVAVLVAAAFSRWVLPRVMPDRPLRPHHGGTVWAAAKAARGPRRAARWIILASLGGLGLMAWSSATPLWEQRLDRLSVSSPERRALDHDLRVALHLPDVARLLLVEGRDADAVLHRQADLLPALDHAVAEGRLGGYRAAASLLPPLAVQRARQEELPSEATLRDNLAEATQGLPVSPSAFEPFVASIARQKAAHPVRPEDVAMGPFAGLIDVPWSAGGSSAATIALVPPVDLRPEEVEGARLIDLRQVASAMVLAYRDQALRWLALGGLAAVGLLAVVLRRPRAVVLALVPAVGAVGTTAALLVVLGTSLSMFHVLALLLVASIGVDYALFFTGYSASEAAGSRSLYSVALCSATTMGVFGVLGFSSLPILSSIGMTVAIGSGLCLPLTLIFCED